MDFINESNECSIPGSVFSPPDDASGGRFVTLVCGDFGGLVVPFSVIFF
jgi:hypothetical protein